jgi:hypothetical protein
MSLREVQTSATRVVHIDRVDDSAVQELKARFRYHPLDIEALFSVPIEPSFSTYGDYCFTTLLWPDSRTGDIRELRFFIDQKQLTIIGDTSDDALRTFIEELRRNLGSREAQYTVPELFHEALFRLRTSWSNTSAVLTTPIASHLISNAQVIRQLARWLQTSSFSAAVPQLIIDAHAIDSLSERQPVEPLEAPANVAAKLTVPSLVQMYTVVSAFMVLVVIVTLSIS